MTCTCDTGVRASVSSGPISPRKRLEEVALAILFAEARVRVCRRDPVRDRDGLI